MSGVIITDCHDDNARGRVSGRLESVTGQPSTFVSIPGTLDDAAELAAAGNLVDHLDALGGRRGIILVNVAPRKDDDNENGSPFGYFWYGETLVVSTVDGKTLSIAKQLGACEDVYVFDLPASVSAMVDRGFIHPDRKDAVIASQFRSYTFLPLAAHLVREDVVLPADRLALSRITSLEHEAIWWIDNFGNCKTTLIPARYDLEHGSECDTVFGTLRYYDHLSDVPDGETALVQGSSGLHMTRFAELVVKGRSAADALSASLGDRVL